MISVRREFHRIRWTTFQNPFLLQTRWRNKSKDHLIDCFQILTQGGDVRWNEEEGASVHSVLFLHHTPAKPSDNHKVSPQTFENHMVGSGTLTCTPENNMVALGTSRTPGNHTDEQLRRHLMRCTLRPQGTIVIECSWQGRLETVYKNRFTLFATPSFPSGIWFNQQQIGQRPFHMLFPFPFPICHWREAD